MGITNRLCRHVPMQTTYNQCELNLRWARLLSHASVEICFHICCIVAVFRLCYICGFCEWYGFMRVSVFCFAEPNVCSIVQVWLVCHRMIQFCVNEPGLSSVSYLQVL